MHGEDDRIKVGNKVNIKVEEIRGCGYCNKHEVGEKWVYPDDVGGICHQALNSMMPTLFMLCQGGVHMRATVTGNRDELSICCPDPLRPVVFKLERGKDHMIPRVDRDGNKRHEIF